MTKELHTHRADVFASSVVGPYTVEFKPWSFFNKNTQSKAIGVHRLESSKRNHCLGIKPEWYLNWAENSQEIFDLVMDTAIHESGHLIQFQRALNDWRGKWPQSHGPEWIREMRNMGIHEPSPHHGGKRWFQKSDGEIYAHLFNTIWEDYQTYREVAYEEFEAEMPNNS
jgi:hypothetical protein